MLSLVICRPGVFRKKEDFAELAIDLHLHIGIGHKKKTRKKGNPKINMNTTRGAAGPPPLLE